MTPTEYTRLAMRTLNDMGLRDNLAHASMLISSEGGEVVTLIKRNFAYGKPLEVERIIDELGDLLWGIALVCDQLSVPMEEMMKANIAKLEARFPDKCFNAACAINPDKGNEAVAQQAVTQG